MLNEKVRYLVSFFSGAEKMASELIRNFVCLFCLFVFFLPNGKGKCDIIVSVYK